MWCARVREESRRIRRVQSKDIAFRDIRAEIRGNHESEADRIAKVSRRFSMEIFFDLAVSSYFRQKHDDPVGFSSPVGFLLDSR